MANVPVQLSPGVNTTEIDLTGIIPAVSSSIAAIAGVFKWGPVNSRYLVTNESELVYNFGYPDDTNFETWLTSSSFLSYADKLYVTRCSANSFNAIAGPTINSSSTSNTVVKNVDDFNAQVDNLESNTLLYYVAKWPGTPGGSLRISVCDSATAYSSVLTGNSSGNATFSFTVGSNQATLTVVGANVSIANTMAANLVSQISVNDLLQAGNTVIGLQGMKVTALSNVSSNVSSNTATATISFQAPYTLSSNVNANSITRFWEFAPFIGNAPTTTPYTAALGGSGDEMHVVVVDDDGYFSNVAGEVLETWPNLSRATDAQGEQGGSIYYRDFLNHSSRFVWQVGDRAGALSGRANSMVAATTTTPLNLAFWGGTDGYDETTIPPQYLASGYDTYKSTEDVDVSLIIAGKARGGVGGELLINYIDNNITTYRKDCILFASPERGTVVNNFYSPEQAVTTFSSYVNDSSYIFLDSGYKYMYDRYNDIYRWIPLCGDMAGLAAQTDRMRDPWWSFAGFNRGFVKNVVKLAFNPDKGRRDILYPASVNPVVTFRQEGTVLYGDKTHLAKPSAFDRINVRRLFIVLEKAISLASKYSLFEFNDEFTRAQFVNMVEPYLREVQGRRGIYDFKVICNETNNTPEVIDSNQFVGDIYIKPARSINYIQLNFVAVRTGVTFETIIGKF